MACHYPSPESVELLRQALVSMNFTDRQGIDADVSEYGIPYKYITANDASASALCDMAKSHLKREFDNGATEIIWRKAPLINGFEEGRQHSFALVLEYHTLPQPGVASEVTNGGVDAVSPSPHS